MSMGEMILLERKPHTIRAEMQTLPQGLQHSLQEIAERNEHLGIACWAEPALVLWQRGCVQGRLQALLMVSSAAVAITQDDVIFLQGGDLAQECCLAMLHRAPTLYDSQS